METKKSTFTLGTPEEVRAWFYRAKARIAAREEEIWAMYKEEHCNHHTTKSSAG